jgi:cytochrome P450
MASTSFAANPHAMYRQWLAAAPAHSVAGGNEYIVLGFDAVSHVLRSTDFSSSPNRVFAPVLHGADPPEHTKIRRQVQSLFEHRSISARRDEIRDRTQSRVTGLMSMRKFDAVADLAVPLARETACAWLGLDEREAARFLSHGGKSATWENLRRAMQPDGAFARALESAGLGATSATQLMAFLVVAGVDTVRDCILLCLLAVLRDTRIVDLMTGPVAATVAELLRLEPPVHTVVRRATVGSTVDGVAIPEGATVWASIGSANRDPSRFDRADEFVLGRSRSALSFGAGVHACPGRQLGSIEVEEAMLALIPHLPRLMSSAREPVIAFTGPGGAPALRQIAAWRLSFR